jgi:hypothetical protein
MPFDDGSRAVDLSRAAKQWQAVGEEKVVVGRNSRDPNVMHRLSCVLDAIGPFRKAEELWLLAAESLKAGGERTERSAGVAEQQAAACGRQIEFCGETFHEIVLQWAYDQGMSLSPEQSRIAAYEYERSGKGEPLDALIPRFKSDPILRRVETWGEDEDLWWLEG